MPASPIRGSTPNALRRAVVAAMRRRAVVAAMWAASAAALAGLSAARVGAQMPGMPVLQNGFTSPGLVVAANYGEQRNAYAFGAALAWGLRNGRGQMTGGVGGLNPKDVSSSLSYGGRAMWVVWQGAAERLGVAVFGGWGGTTSDDVSMQAITLGAGVGYRWSLAERTVSVYGTPMYRRDRNKLEAGSSLTGDLFRLAIGIDAAVFPRLGVTIGYELGQEASVDEAGPAGALFGIGVSYALR